MSRGYHNGQMMPPVQTNMPGQIPVQMSLGTPTNQQGFGMSMKGGTPQQMGSRGMHTTLGNMNPNMQQQIVPNSANSQRIQHSSGSLPVSRKSLSASFSSSMRGSTAGSNWDNQTALNDDDNVRVVVRCRPMNENERNRNDKQVLYVEESQTAVTLRAPGGGGREVMKNYRFNMCFLPKTSQEQFFNNCGIKNLLDSALNGYAATVFAYGQTGSGKTFTISGIEERISDDTSGSQWDGLIPRSVRYAFERIAATQEGTTYSVRASFAEIYNEQVYDLLNLQSGPLQVRWNIRNGFFVQDLFVVECENTSDVMAVVKEGHRNRRVGSHELNMDSSRSHSLLTLHLESESIDSDDGHTMVKFGKMVFVDLAGSERLKQTQSDGVTRTETGMINQSLFTLGKVISALGSKHNKNKSKDSKFVPYRDSKLTKLLMDSLGGSCLTLMVACCSPSEAYMEETLSTLNYATRARNIQNKPMIQMDQKEQLIFNLRQEVKLLRLENDFLRQQLSIHNGGVIPSSPYTRSEIGTPLNGTMTPRSPGSAIGKHKPGKGGNGPPGLPMSPQTQNTGGGYSRAPPHHVPPLGGPPNSSNGGGTAYNSDGNGPPGLTQAPPPGIAPKTNGRGVRGPSPRAPKSKSSVTDTQMQKMLSTYRREIERLKTENREVRARGSVAERGYRAVMAENERLCNKLEHLEEIFVHQSRQTPWPKGEEGGTQQGNSKKDSGEWEKKIDEGGKDKFIRKMKAENSSLRIRVQRLEKSLKQGEGNKFRQIDPEKKNNRESERDVIALQKMNVELQNRLEKYRKREMELLRALKAQQAKAQRRKVQESSNSPVQHRRSSSTLQQQSQ